MARKNCEEQIFCNCAAGQKLFGRRAARGLRFVKRPLGRRENLSWPTLQAHAKPRNSVMSVFQACDSPNAASLGRACPICHFISL